MPNYGYDDPDTVKPPMYGPTPHTDVSANLGLKMLGSMLAQALFQVEQNRRKKEEDKKKAIIPEKVQEEEEQKQFDKPYTEDDWGSLLGDDESDDGLDTPDDAPDDNPDEEE